jgi:hypothetical protein
VAPNFFKEFFANPVLARNALTFATKLAGGSKMLPSTRYNYNYKKGICNKAR